MADVMKQILKAPAAMLTIALLLAMTTSTVALNPLKASAAANQTNTARVLIQMMVQIQRTQAKILVKPKLM
jgi:hypothetical protein